MNHRRITSLFPQSDENTQQRVSRERKIQSVTSLQQQSAESPLKESFDTGLIEPNSCRSAGPKFNFSILYNQKGKTRLHNTNK